MGTAVLGISAYYHDSAAAIIVDGEIIAAAQEERFTRKKHDASFPHHSVDYVLEEAGIPLEKVTMIVFYEKPLIKFERLLETYHAFAPVGLMGFVAAMPVWMNEKLFMRKTLKSYLAKIGKTDAKILFTEHHLSHAAAAFFPSPFEEAAILTIDGVGEWATTTICRGNGSEIEVLKELHFPHSLGLLYSAFTQYIGFRVNSGEYKLMGLAPYGDPDSSQTLEFKKKILDALIDIRADGSFLLNMDYFGFAARLEMTKNKKWEKLFGIPPRVPESEISQEYMNLAMAIQQVTEDIILKLAAHAKEITQCRNLVLSGGVALNCVANGKLLKTGLFNDIWIQPAAGDSGGAIGAALAAWYINMEKPRIPHANDSMDGALLGPDFTDTEIEKIITKYDAKASHYYDEERLCSDTAALLNKGNIVGWFQGRMEFGPRALGNRSILADARNPEMQKKLNLKIKQREGFRPFAPSVLEEDIADYFDLDKVSPYMLFVAPVKLERCIPAPLNSFEFPFLERLYHSRSDIPSVTHIDYSARIQSVGKSVNPRFHNLLSKFKDLTQYGILINTSFNVRGEPIVCSPDDAYRCFMSTEMDYLVMGNYLFNRQSQPQMPEFTKRPKGED